MGQSQVPGPGNSPWGVCSVPPRSPGVLGHNDGADPTVFSLLGDTPGVVGCNDHGDPTLPQMSFASGAAGTIARLLDGTRVSFGPFGTGAQASEQSCVTEITLELLKAAEAGNSDEYCKSILPVMNQYARAYAITSKLRVAHFLAQVAHESAFKVTQENGNYKPKRMREIFGCKGGPKNYDATADDCKLGVDGQPMRLRDKLWEQESTYAHNAKNLLSYTYASRLGNGNEASGDGYRYRGRGLIQLTGKTNYRKFTDAHNAKNPSDPQDFVAKPDLLVSELKYGIESAFYFWDANGLNAIADTDDVEDVTRAVNGGLNGIADRKARLASLKKILEI